MLDQQANDFLKMNFMEEDERESEKKVERLTNWGMLMPPKEATDKVKTQGQLRLSLLKQIKYK